MRDTPSIPRSDAVDAAAAGWLARRDAGLTPGERAEFESWLTADPAHASIMREFDYSWKVLDEAHLKGTGRVMARELAARMRRRRFRRLSGWGAAIAASLALAFTMAKFPDRRHVAASAPVVIRPESEVLPDGSRVELNQRAEIAVDFNERMRAVRLVKGEAHFSVAADATRPFVVSAGAVAVRAVGTAFAVRLEETAVDVIVTEGRVAVERPERQASDSPVLVDAGDRVRVAAQGGASFEKPAVLPVEPAELERRLAWRGPRLELNGTPLADAVAVFNRENSLRIVVHDPSLARMRLSGIFRADNAEGFVRILEETYGVVVKRDPGSVVLQGTESGDLPGSR